MTVIVTLYKDADRDAFIADMAALGHVAHPYSHIPRMLCVHGVTVADFPAHPLVQSAVDGDERHAMHATQSISLTSGTGGAVNGGAWALLRHTSVYNPVHVPGTFTYTYNRQGAGVDVYLIDSGIASHQEFSANPPTVIWECSDPMGSGDHAGHGTATTACVMGVSVGFARLVNVFMMKAFTVTVVGGNATALGTDLITAFNTVLSHSSSRHNPAVLSCSFGSTADTGWAAAIEACIDAGITVVASAGNSTQDLASNPSYPGSDTDVICVGATNYADGIASFSNYGTRVDVFAAGANCWLPDFSGYSSYKPWSGTSFSCPYTAGAIAAILGGYGKPNSRAHVQAIRSFVQSSASTGFVQNIPVGSNRLLFLDPGAGPYATISGIPGKTNSRRSSALIILD